MLARTELSVCMGGVKVSWRDWRVSWVTGRAQGARAAPRTLPRCPWGGEGGGAAGNLPLKIYKEFVLKRMKTQLNCLIFSTESGKIVLTHVRTYDM